MDVSWPLNSYLSAVPSRAIQAEVAQKQNDEENKVKWNVDVKQLVTDLQEKAQKEFEDMAKSIPADEESTTVPSSKSRKHGRGKQKHLSESEDSGESDVPPRGKKPSRVSSGRHRGSGRSDGENEPRRTSRVKVWSGLGNIGKNSVACSIKAFGFTLQ